MSDKSLRTPLGRVRGLGSAKDGVHHWWLQRLTALALIPLLVWFVASLISLVGAEREAVLHWLANPIVALLLLLLILSGFWHMKLGVQVVIEDYVHIAWMKITGLILNVFFTIAVGGGCALAVLTILFGG